MLAVLLVEDESAIAETVVYSLQREGYAVKWVTTGRDALAALREQPFALAVLDVGLPDQSGFDLYRALQREQALPAVFLTARNDEIDRIVGFELGADDYVTKPFSPRELMLRVKAVLRRQAAATPAGSDSLFAHEPERAGMRFCGRALALTASEYRLLAYLCAKPERVFSREQLLRALGATAEASGDRAIDTLIKQIRAKLRAVRADLDPIVTHRGFGYSLRLKARSS